MRQKIKDILKKFLLFVLILFTHIAITGAVLYLVSVAISKLWNIIPEVSFYLSSKQVFLVLIILWILKITFTFGSNEEVR